MIYLDMFLGFLRVGCFSFGGAYSAIPLIRDVILSYGWLSDEMLTDMIAVSESTPGPIMVNLATYVGSSQAGFAGAVIATLAVALPSFVVILLVAAALKTTLKNQYIQAVLRGLKPCITGIILATGAYMLLNNCFMSEDSFANMRAAGNTGIFVNLRAVFLTILLAAIWCGTKGIVKKKLPPVALIVISAFLGMFVYAM